MNMEFDDSQRLLLQEKGFALSKTTGRSMRPVMWGGDHCVVVAHIKGEPSVGDVLFFIGKHPDGREDRIGILHRLVAIEQEGDRTIYITRGDNCVACERVLREDIVGRVVEVHRVTGFKPWHILPMKRFSAESFAFRVYSQIWMRSWPLRRPLMILRNKLVRILKASFKHFPTPEK